MIGLTLLQGGHRRAANAPATGGGGTPPDPNIDLDPTRSVYDTGFAGNRKPQFVVDAQWRTEMQAAITANDPYMTKLKFRADTSASAPFYGDGGHACAAMYQITGTASYATQALTKLTANLSENLKVSNNGNHCREEFWSTVILYDWLYAAMTNQQRTDLMARLFYFAEYAVGQDCPPYVGGMHPGDSDAAVSYLGALVLMDCLNVTENTRRGEWLQKPAGGMLARPVGGVNSTGDNNDTMRNVIYRYFTTLFAGGCWGESSEYNPGTSILWTGWYSAVKSAMLTEHFPEVAAYLGNAMKWFVQDLYPNQSGRRHWSDDENPRDSRWFSQYEVAMNLAGLLTRAGSADAPLAMYHAARCLAVDPAVINWGLIFRSPICSYNPLAATAANYNAMPMSMAVAVGHRAVNFGTFGGDRVWIYAPTPIGVDHAGNIPASPQVWYDNELTLDTNVSYLMSGIANSNNSLLFCGLDGMANKAIVRNEGSNGVWGCQTSTTDGPRYGPPFWDPPPTFVVKAESRVVAFKENGWLVVVARDDLDVKDPSTLPNYDRYPYAGDTGKLSRALARGERVVRIWHTNAAPTDVTGGFKWTTVGGHDCYVYHPVGFGTKIHYNEKTDNIMLYDDAVSYDASQGANRTNFGFLDHPTLGDTRNELKFQTRILTPVQDVTVTVQVYVVGPGGGTPPTISSASASAITVGTKVVTFNANSTTVA